MKQKFNVILLGEVWDFLVQPKAEIEKARMIMKQYFEENKK